MAGIPLAGALAWNQIKTTRPITHYRTTIYADPSNADMDDVRNSLSKMKKKFKRRLPRRKHKPDGTGATSDGNPERVDSTSSPPRPGPRPVADKSYDREGNRADAAGEQVSSANRPSQLDGPESVPACGSDNGQGGGEADVDRGEASQRNSRPHSDVEITVGSGRDGIYPSPSTPSISHSGEPDGT